MQAHDLAASVQQGVREPARRVQGDRVWRHSLHGASDGAHLRPLLHGRRQEAEALGPQGALQFRMGWQSQGKITQIPLVVPEQGHSEREADTEEETHRPSDSRERRHRWQQSRTQGQAEAWTTRSRQEGGGQSLGHGYTGRGTSRLCAVGRLQALSSVVQISLVSTKDRRIQRGR